MMNYGSCKIIINRYLWVQFCKLEQVHNTAAIFLWDKQRKGQVRLEFGLTCNTLFMSHHIHEN